MILSTLQKFFKIIANKILITLKLSIKTFKGWNVSKNKNKVFKNQKSN